MFHPRCKDSTSTYYEGITALKTVSDDELAAMSEREELEAEQNYAARQARRFERREKYSLDPDNKRIAGARKKQWENKSEKLQKELNDFDNNNPIKSVANSDESGIIEENNAKSIEMFNYSDISDNEVITVEKIVDDLRKTDIGQETLSILETLPEPVKFTYGEYSTGVRGTEMQGKITIYLNNCKNVLWTSRSLIHECTHYRYGIGKSQWAECVCVAQELKHARGRNYLLYDELKKVVRAVKDAYPEYNWRKGGIINGRRKSR